MAGLQNNDNTYALAQWHKLFTDQSATRSIEAYNHWKYVERLGLPTCQHEHWKYTPLNKLLSHRFTNSADNTVSVANRDALSLVLDACRLVFVNGCFSPLLSDKDTDLWRVEVDKGAARRSLPVPIQSEVFLHLTESLSKETTYICLPTGKTATRPLYLLHISQGNENQDMLNTMYYRHHINIMNGAKGQVIEHFVSMNTKGHFSGARTSMEVSDNAHLSHIKLAFECRASYHFGHNDISAGRDAVVQSSTFIFGSGLTRHQTSAQLNGEGSDLKITSLLLPSGQGISDTRTYLEHNKGYCLSRQLHKVIARGRGKGIFNGVIKVAKHALKTNSQMTNNNLLLDEQAEIDTKPQLEIYADDVKCSHGVTVSQIDIEQLFYLRSRGIANEDARQMIMYAFATEVTESMNNNKVRDIILARIANSLQKR